MNADRDPAAKRNLLTVSNSASNKPFLSKPLSKQPQPQTSGADAGAGDSHVTLCQGQAVYVYDAEDCWKEAWVMSVDQTKNVMTVKIKDTEQISTYSSTSNHVLLCPKSTKLLEEINNLTDITPVHEASVLACLHKRYVAGSYYTNAGTTVVAINPFTDVSHLYTLQQIEAYHARRKDLPPHIYTVAETAYSSLVRELGNVNQSIIISGESGAGKTVTAKHLLRYLAIITNPLTESSSRCSVDRGGKIEQRILDSNPILEAFGNAATPRNNNSSRFGKFIELQFLRMGQIQGGSIQTYLLEKTRVAHQGQGENNFHVFYQMTGLREGEDWYPNWVQDVQSEVSSEAFTCVPLNQDCSSSDDMRVTLDAMTDIGLSQGKQQHVFQVLLAILHLGNVRFVQVSDDSSELDSSNANSSFESQGFDESLIEVSVSERALERSCQLLGLDAGGVRQTLLHRSLQAGAKTRRSVFVKPIGIQEARSRRDCLNMLLYSRVFEWLVGFINHQIKADFYDNVIGLLDIYGFEAFAINSLEQLCINYANERLQQYYITQFLQHLQREYTEECLRWTPVDCSDNKPCLNVLDGRASVFSLLNEEVYLNRRSDDEALKERVLQLCVSSHNALRPARRPAANQPSFMVQHYAGEVHYLVSGLVNKNKDDIPPELISLLTASTNSFVRHLFSSQAQQSSPSTRKKKTVLTKFKSSLDELLASMEVSDMHYIRCLKPNTSSAPTLFQPPYLLQQLKASGAIQTVNICRRGYPSRMLYSEFQQRYSLVLRMGVGGKGQDRDRCRGDALSGAEADQKENICDPLDLLLRQQLEFPASPGRTPTPRKKMRRRTGLTQQDHARKVCATILQTVVQPPPPAIDLQHQFGLSKIFLTEHQLEVLEVARLQCQSAGATVLQSAWRGVLCRRRCQRLRAGRAVWAQWRTFCTRREFLALRHATLVLQTGVRRWLHQLRLQRQLQQQQQRTTTPHHAPSSSPARQHQQHTLSSSSSIHHHHHQQQHPSASRLSNPLHPPPPASSDSLLPASLRVSSSSSSSSNNDDDDNDDDDKARFSTDPLLPRQTTSEAFVPHSHQHFHYHQHYTDGSGNLSDDSGVMVHEPLGRRERREEEGGGRGRKREGESLLGPEQKRRRLLALAARLPQLGDVQVGDGVVTRRRIPKFGARFHTRESVLKYSHRVNRQDLPSGLGDAVTPDDLLNSLGDTVVSGDRNNHNHNHNHDQSHRHSEGSSVDP